MTSEADDRPRFDLQAHSQHSDGALRPAQVVELAKATGVELLALTDHDTVAGVEEAVSAGRAAGIAVVPAAELSAIDANREDLHVLGYGIDHRRAALLSALAEFRADREARAERMAAALAELGLHLNDAVLDSRRRSGGSIGRPHLARAVIEDGRNSTRLAEEGLERAEQVLQAYLLPGKPAYRRRTKPGVREAIDVIHAAGGVAVWAHPFWDIEAPAEVLSTLEQFVARGLDGVEAFYITHDAAQTHLLDDASRRLDLLGTGSSDFHGPDHSIFSRFRAFSLYGREPRLGSVAERVGYARRQP